MNVDLPELFNALGGGPLAVAFVGLAFLYWRLLNRNDKLVDTIIDMGDRQTEAMNNLAREIEKATDK